MVTVEQQQNVLPIIGHSVFSPNQAIEMTEAIDVVFYESGYAQINGFELGKDLLWFFLPEEKIAQARKTVNDAGDLTLDFGNQSALTF